MNQPARAHYVSPLLEVRNCRHKGGDALHARAEVRKGELLVVWGGTIVTGSAIERLSPRQRSYTLQVEEDLYQVSGLEDDPGDRVNHSCNPNAGLSGPIALVAMRNILPGEEVCFDYAMSDGSAYDEFDCACGQRQCRGRVSGEDWRRPELQRRYRRYFSPYLQRRIERLRREMRVIVDNTTAAIAG